MWGHKLEEALKRYDGCTRLPMELEEALLRLAAQPHEVGRLDVQTLPWLAFAAASCSPVQEAVIDAVCNLIPVADLSVYEPADLTALVWALAVADRRDRRVFAALGQHLCGRAWEFRGNELAQLLYAFAELRIAHHAMMETICMEVMWKIDEFSARSLTVVVESCARLGFCKPSMFGWVAERVIGRMEDYSPEDLATVLWAFTEGKVKHDVLARSIAREIAYRKLYMHEEDLSRAVWAVNELMVEAPGITQFLFHPKFRMGQ